MEAPVAGSKHLASSIPGSSIVSYFGASEATIFSKRGIAQLSTAYTSSFRINSRSFAVLFRRRSSRGSGFRHHPDLLREGDEARVVLVGAQERIGQQLVHTRFVRGPGVVQPLEHLLRLLAQGIDLGDLAAGGVGVFVDQFF